MDNVILESFIPRDTPAPLWAEKAEGWVPLLEEMLRGEYAAMLFYLQASYAMPREISYFDYYGKKNKDVHFQLRCHGMHDMRHAEMLGRTIVRYGKLPTLEMETLPAVTTYGDLLKAAKTMEKEKLARYHRTLGYFDDPEIFLMLSHIMRENEIHAALDEQLLGVLTAEGWESRALPPTGVDGQFAEDVKMLQRVFYLEAYSIVHLIYLSTCLGFDQSLAPRLRALSIEHMKHLNDVGHALQDLGALAQVPLNISFIGSNQLSVNMLLEKNIRIMEQKAEEMGIISQQVSSEKIRGTIAMIVPKELENASDLRAYLGSLNSLNQGYTKH